MSPAASAGRRRSSRAAKRRKATTSHLPRTTRSSSAATERSRPGWRSSCRRRMTPKSAGYRSRTTVCGHAKSRSRRTRRLCSRRRRAPEETEIWLAHVLAVEGETIGDLEWETDRGQFLGRGRRVRAPQAETDGHELSDRTGSVLEQIVSLSRRVRVRPGKTVRVAFSTLVAPSRKVVLDLADKYHDVTTFERVATLAWTQAQVQMHHLGIGPDEAHLFQSLGGSILYADRALRA